MRRVLGFLLVLAISVAVPARAEPTSAEKQKAAHSFQIGTAAYAKGDFANAAAAFEKAAMYAPHPSTLLNAAESWELAENPVRAAQLSDRVLETPGLESMHRQAAQKQLARVEKKIGTIIVKAPSKARIEVDEREERGAREEPRTTLRVSPGPHKVRVTDPQGESRSESLSVSGGETKDLDFLTPPPKAEETRPSPLVEQHKREREESSSRGPPVASWICFAGGAVASGVAIYFGAQALSAKDDFDSRPTTTSRDTFNSSVIATDVAIGVAAVGFVVGFVLWATSGKSEPVATQRLRRLEMTW